MGARYDLLQGPMGMRVEREGSNKEDFPEEATSEQGLEVREENTRGRR